MVCQRSRDRRSSNSANKAPVNCKLPAKEMPVPNANHTMQQIRPTLAPTLASACVSSDDNSSSSSSNVSAPSSAVTSHDRRTSLLNVALPPTTVCTNSTTTPILKPPSAGYVSKDEAIIKSAIKQSVENERIRTARAMLYHSYMQALGASGR